MERKWNWLIRYLISDGEISNLDIAVTDERLVKHRLVEAMAQLHPKHAEPMIAYYWEDKPRDAMMAQALFHGRMALWAAVRWGEGLGLKELKEMIRGE